MFDAKSKVLEQIMEMADEAMMKKAMGKKKPSMVAMSVESCAPKDEDEKKEAPPNTRSNLCQRRSPRPTCSTTSSAGQ